MRPRVNDDENPLILQILHVFDELNLPYVRACVNISTVDAIGHPQELISTKPLFNHV